MPVGILAEAAGAGESGTPSLIATRERYIAEHYADETLSAILAVGIQSIGFAARFRADQKLSIPIIYAVERSAAPHIADDESLARALGRLLTSAGYEMQSYSSGSAFLAEARLTDSPGCVLLDFKMPGLSGLEVQAALAERGARIPVLFLSGEADVPSSATAFRLGAKDFLTKPVSKNTLLDSVRTAIEAHHQILSGEGEHRRLMARYATLTKREREVAVLVTRGMLNKQIAAELGTAERTVKIHPVPSDGEDRSRLRPRTRPIH